MGKHKHHKRSSGDYNHLDSSSGVGLGNLGLANLGLGNLGSIFENFDLNNVISLLNKIDINALMPMINNIMGNLGNLGNSGGNGNNNAIADLLQSMNNNNINNQNNIDNENNFGNMNNDIKEIIDQFSEFYSRSSNEALGDEISEENFDSPNVINGLSDYDNLYDDEVVKLLESIKNIASEENIDKIDRVIQKYIEGSE